MRARRTIVVASNTTWSLFNFRAAFMAAMLAEGYRVIAVAPVDDKAENLAAMGCDIEPIVIDRAGINPLNDALTIRRFRSLYARLRPDLAIQYTIKPVIYGGMACAGLGIPAMHVITGLGTAFLHDNWMTRIAEGLYRFGLKHAAQVYFLNEVDRETFLKRRLLLPAQADVLPGEGVDTSHFGFVAGSHRSGDDIHFLMVARALRDKGLLEYVDASRVLRLSRPGLRFQFVGPVGVSNRSSFSRDDMAAWVADGSLEYLGAVDDVRPALEASDCVVLPSYREGLSRSLIEAAAVGRPLIATNVPGCREVVSDGVNGFLCAARDANSLAAALGRMADLSTQSRLAMGASSREICCRAFSLDEVISRLLSRVHQLAH